MVHLKKEFEAFILKKKFEHLKKIHPDNIMANIILSKHYDDFLKDTQMRDEILTLATLNLQNYYQVDRNLITKDKNRVKYLSSALINGIAVDLDILTKEERIQVFNKTREKVLKADRNIYLLFGDAMRDAEVARYIREKLEKDPKCKSKFAQRDEGWIANLDLVREKMQGSIEQFEEIPFIAQIMAVCDEAILGNDMIKFASCYKEMIYEYLLEYFVENLPCAELVFFNMDKKQGIKSKREYDKFKKDFVLMCLKENKRLSEKLIQSMKFSSKASEKYSLRNVVFLEEYKMIRY